VLQKIPFQINALLLHFLFTNIYYSYSLIHHRVHKKYYAAKTVLSTALITGINSILKYIHIENRYFKLVLNKYSPEPVSVFT